MRIDNYTFLTKISQRVFQLCETPHLGILKSTFTLLLVTMFTFYAEAQTGRDGRGLSNSTQSTSLSQSQTLSQSADVLELASKVNTLLNDVRALLSKDGVNIRFRQELAPDIFTKADEYCSKVFLRDLIKGTDSYQISNVTTKQDLLVAIELLTVTYKTLLQY